MTLLQTNRRIPDEAHVMERSRSLRWRIGWIWGYWGRHPYTLLLFVGFTIVSTGVALAYPLVFRSLLDRLSAALEAADPSGLKGLLVVLGLIGFGRIVAAFYPALRARMNLKFEIEIREWLFRRILQKDHHFFTHFRTGDVVTRLTDDLADYPKLTWFMCSGVFRALDSGAKLVFCATAMLLLHAKLALLAVTPLIPLLLVFYWLRRSLYEAFEAQQRAISTTNAMLESVFTGIRIVKGFTNEDGQSERLRAVLGDRVGVQLRVARLHMLFHSIERVASHLGQVVVLAVGGAMVIRGGLSAGTLYALYVYLDMLVHPLMDIPNLFVTARQAFVCMDRADEVASFPVKVSRSPGAPPLDSVQGIELRDVWASYDGERSVLSGVSFAVGAGEKVALVGPVGCGKTSVLKLLAGLMVPDRGGVLVNGSPVGHWEWGSYRQLLGYVPQDTLLFSETIAENVACGRHLSGDTILSALDVAQVRPDVEAMAKGVGSVLSTKGRSLSGGQRGRVAIARAVAGNPQLFLLDDSTAALDARSEDGFWRDILSAYPDATYVVVSHRIATIRRLERVLFLQNGELIADGSHEELIETCPTYAEFVAREELLEHLGVA